MIRKMALAALAAIAVFHVAVFIQYGTLWVGTLAGYLELLLVFAFLLPTFLIHAPIARLFGADRLTKPPAPVKALLEGLCVVLVSLVFWVVFFSFPQHYLVPTAETSPKALRLSLAVSAVLSLFFYYFVEREHVRKNLEQEVVRVAQLQKETFQAQLEALKNQVDPHSPRCRPGRAVPGPTRRRLPRLARFRGATASAAAQRNGTGACLCPPNGNPLWRGPACRMGHCPGMGADSGASYRRANAAGKRHKAQRLHYPQASAHQGVRGQWALSG
jgi:hypothetical protein